ncbi:hypothetical protein Scep_017888 [Stephania cephalantha]|uniref:Denticleless protein homolog n=1 Tax=Stephania cephalantha TaxID=152367 RepID=A0AAP0IQX8_9MAGN
MEASTTAPSSSSSSFFRDLKSRELNGIRVRKRPRFDDLSSDSGVISIEHDGNPNPPLAVSFCNMIERFHLLAVSDEDGYLSFYDTRRKLPSLGSFRESVGEARVCDWVAHNNAIFDLCWIQDDMRILTASGDQTIKVWDVEKKACISALIGHTGSVKSLSCHPSNPGLLVSGSRDGSFGIWDLRCNHRPQHSSEELSLTPTAIVNGAHMPAKRKGTRRIKTGSMSITSVLYLKDEISIASAGAVGSEVKFWDTRNLKAPVTSMSCIEAANEKEKSRHGISSLSQDSSGMFLTASCMNNRIYLYNILQLHKGPMSTFSGNQLDTFYVKSAISPDAAHILSGSSDGNACIWQVKRPQEGPLRLEGHEGEVTAVAWCPSETGKLATCSDDFTVRIWNTQNRSFTCTTSPSSVRRRVMATPGINCRKLFADEEQDTNPSKADRTSSLLADNLIKGHSPSKIILHGVSTPKSAKKKLSASFTDEVTEMDKTPEAALKSPSSVLNPPSSLKRRTIRDYFVPVL